MPEPTVGAVIAGDATAADAPVGLAADYFQSYSVVGLLAVVGVLFVAVAFGAGRLRPVVPTPEKLLTYECGVDPVGEGWAHTQVRYYVYAFLYVIFAVDSIFLHRQPAAGRREVAGTVGPRRSRSASQGSASQREAA
ncbi:NAD(P)H-quinone oxidoreductase subunit 3, chloroplastic [Streptomyces violaceorubidus]